VALGAQNRLRLPVVFVDRFGKLNDQWLDEIAATNFPRSSQADVKYPYGASSVMLLAHANRANLDLSIRQELRLRERR
jgi:hypothetical protein